jgi:hypothetical protein
MNMQQIPTGNRKSSYITVFYVISRVDHDRSPGPDGFPEEFYQIIWDIIKIDLMAMFGQLKSGESPSLKLNFGVITLLPKKENAVQFSNIDLYVF